MNTLEVQTTIKPTVVHFPAPAAEPPIVATEATYCESHPTVETWMRCNKCNRHICLKCAVQTPVGYRCKPCVRVQQNVYFNAKDQDNLIAFAVSCLIALIVTPVVGIIGNSLYFYGFYVAFIAGPGAGMLLAEVIRWTVGRRRSRALRYVVAGGITLGVLMGVALAFLLADQALWLDAPLWIFAGLAATTTYQVLH